MPTKYTCTITSPLYSGVEDDKMTRLRRSKFGSCGAKIMVLEYSSTGDWLFNLEPCRSYKQSRTENTLYRSQQVLLIHVKDLNIHTNSTVQNQLFRLWLLSASECVPRAFVVRSNISSWIVEPDYHCEQRASDLTIARIPGHHRALGDTSFCRLYPAVPDVLRTSVSLTPFAHGHQWYSRVEEPEMNSFISM